MRHLQEDVALGAGGGRQEFQQHGDATGIRSQAGQGTFTFAAHEVVGLAIVGRQGRNSGRIAEGAQAGGGLLADAVLGGAQQKFQAHQGLGSGGLAEGQGGQFADAGLAVFGQLQQQGDDGHAADAGQHIEDTGPHPPVAIQGEDLQVLDDAGIPASAHHQVSDGRRMDLRIGIREGAEA